MKITLSIFALSIFLTGCAPTVKLVVDKQRLCSRLWDREAKWNTAMKREDINSNRELNAKWRDYCKGKQG